MRELTVRTSGGDAFTILPELGAILTSLELSNQEVIKFPLNQDVPRKGYPSALLFPFPNRVRDGIYTFEDETYQLERNQQPSGHAIHGLLAFEPFTIVEEKKNGFTLKYDYFGQAAGYPFPFSFEVKYSLPRKGSFRLSYKVKNTGNGPMPCGFGWHPYFTLGDAKIGDWVVEIPPHFPIEIDESIIPMQAGNFDEKNARPATEIPLKNAFLDNVFKLLPEDETAVITLQNETLTLEIEPSLGVNKLNYFVLYTPPQRNCIAIEPQTCNINAFNNKDGLVVLQPSQVMNGHIDIRLKRK